MRDPLDSVRRRKALLRRSGALLLALLVAGNAAAIVWLWVHGGNLHPHSTGDLLTGIGRLTGLLGAYLALIQVVLLARLPVLERAVGFDRLTVWHRWNGHVCIDLILAHVVFTVWGYALVDKYPLGKEISTMLGSGIYPGMITATVGTGMMIAVVATSIVVVRRGCATSGGTRCTCWHTGASRSRGSTRFRPGTNSCSTALPRTTGAPSTLPRSPCS